MLKRRIWFGLIGAALASGVAAQQYATIIDNLPTCIGNRNGRVISVSDAVDEADCTVGGAVGDARVVHQCICDTLNVLGPYWKSTAGSGGGLADGDKGDITVASSGAAWTVDANAVALGTDTTGNYAGSASEGGEANTLAPAVVIEGATADGFEGNFAFTDPTADWTWTWGATGAVSGVASITGGTSGSSTLSLDGDSTVTGAATVTTDGRIIAGVGGTVTNPAFKLPGGNSGIFDDWGTGGVCVAAASARSVSFVVGGAYELYVDSNELLLSTDIKLGWGVIGGAHDVAFTRASAANLNLTDGNGGSGSLNLGGMVVDLYPGGDADGGSWNSTEMSVYPGIILLGPTYDVGIARNAAGVLRVTDASTGIGSVLSTVLVEANTAVAASPNILTANESGSLLTNEGIAAQNYHTLPTATAGLCFEFAVQDADGIRVVANTGDTIRIAGSVSASAGYIQNSTIGSTIKLCAINATEWFAKGSPSGTWTIDS